MKQDPTVDVESLLNDYESGHRSARREVRKRLNAHLLSIKPKGWHIGHAVRRPRLAMSRVVRARLRMRFGICPLCGLVLYGATPSRPSTCFHRPCWRLFTKSWPYRRWRGSRTRQTTAAFPWPAVARGRGRPKDLQNLHRRYELLMRRAAPESLGGRSGYELAAASGVSQRAVAKGLISFVEMLPGAWDLVFQGKPTGNWRRSNDARQRLFPLPAVWRDRGELVRRLIAMGMSEQDASGLAGVSLPIVQSILFSKKPA